jgi:hypothetical protein
MKQGYLGVQSTYIAIYSFSSTYIVIYSIDQKKVFGELTSVCRRRRLPCTCGKAAAVVEEEAGSSGVDGGGVDRLERRQWRWMKLVE